MRMASQRLTSRLRVQLDGSWITRAGIALRLGIALGPSVADFAGAVVVANVHDRTVTYSFYHSMMELLHNDAHNHQRVWRAGYIDMSYSTDGLAESRNTAVVKFLEEKRADWLLWIDTDMGFPPDMIERLMADADPVERPIVGALAFTWRHQIADQMGGWRCLATPTLFDWGHGDNGEMGFIVR